MREYRKINSEHYISFRLCSSSVQFFIFSATSWWFFFVYICTHMHTHTHASSIILIAHPAFFINHFLKFLTIVCVIFNLIQYL